MRNVLQIDNQGHPAAGAHKKSAGQNAAGIADHRQAGKYNLAARYFGAITNSIGSIPMARRASISSVTTMLPISAENADPDRPLTAIAVSRGPSSRVNPIVTRSVTNSIAP